MALSSGHKLGPYEVLSPIGAGGMGKVYKARDTRLDRTVAIKVSAREFGERFQREAQAIASLNHPNICTLHDVGPDYLVMEFIEGAEIKGPLPIAEVLRLAIQIAEAVNHAHRHGVIHREWAIHLTQAVAGGSTPWGGRPRPMPLTLWCKVE